MLLLHAPKINAQNPSNVSSHQTSIALLPHVFFQRTLKINNKIINKIIVESNHITIWTVKICEKY